MQLLHALWTDESGQDLVEYVFVLFIVSTAVGIAIAGFRQELVTMFTDVTTLLRAL